MAQLFDALASAEMVFAGHDENYRLHFKAIRSKEEGLASLKRNQSSLAGKIDSQERKVSKMREENKVRHNSLWQSEQRLMVQNALRICRVPRRNWQRCEQRWSAWRIQSSMKRRLWATLSANKRETL